MADQILKAALQTFGHTQAIKDGTLKVPGFTFAFEEVPLIIQAFRRMVRGDEFDVTEMAITTYMCAREFGKPFTALPVFVVRAFHHDAILVDTTRIKHPKDLEGQKIGVNRGFTVTRGTWARGILQHQYGVDLGKITWVLSGDEHVTEWRPPGNVVPVPAGQTVEGLVASGELAGAIGIEIDHPDVKPLIPDAKAVALDTLRTTGQYPINHTVVVKNALLAANPHFARDLFAIFAEAKQGYVERLRAGAIDHPTPTDKTYRSVLDITGDPLPYGIESNRQALETIARFAGEQGILRKPVDIPGLFAAGTHDLTA